MNEQQCRQLSAKFPSVLESVNNAQIGVGPRENMRESLNAAKTRLDDLDKATKAAMAGQVLDEAKKLCVECEGKDFLVHVFNAGSNAKALNAALKEMGKSLPATAVMALSLDAGADKVLCLTQVPKV